MKITFQAFLLLFCLLSSGAFAQSTGGIGASLKLDTAQNGTTLPKILSIVPNSPAAARNLQAGWYIVTVNGLPCKNKSLEDVVSNIRGAEGTTVKIEIADNPQGKKAIEYTLTRATIATNNNTPLPDPKDAFVMACEQEVKLLKRKGHSIAKAVSSDCGDYFFSFDATEGNYVVKLLALAPVNTISAEVYDSRTETLTTSLVAENNNSTTATLTANIKMAANSAGVVSVTIKEPQTNCKGMYIIVYK